MSWLDGFQDRIERDVPLAPWTSFRLGGRARHLYHPGTEARLARLIERARTEGVPARVLGGGANVLVRDDGVDGIVIRLDDPTFRSVSYEGPRVSAGGGADLMQLTLDCARRGLAGMECMAGIPGTVGGALCMNAGGRFGAIGDVVSTVRLLTPEGRIESVDAAALHFGYRRSRIGRRIVLAAELVLRPDDPRRTLARYRQVWAYKRSSQPLAEHSAGCIFKNPPDQSAGKLVDQAGLKGETVGGATVSSEHANFIVTRQGARAEDVLRLVERIRDTVRQRFGVELETEIDIW